MHSEISAVATGDMWGEVGNPGLHMIPEGDVFGIGSSSGMVLGGGACREGPEIVGISVGGY